MVLVRSSYAARFIEASFLNADIPYRFIGGTKLMESAHIRDVLAAVRVVVNPHDEIGWMRFLTLWDGLGETTAAKYIELFMRHASLSDSIAYLKTASKLDVQASTLLDSLSHLSQDAPAALNLAIAMLTPILEDRYANKEWDKRKKDIALLSQLAATYTSVSEFMTDYVLDPVTSSDAAHGEHQDIVTLITVHSAKGAECPVCYVSNVSSGAYPSYRSKGDTDAIEEERRVLYVALTRAQNELLPEHVDNIHRWYEGYQDVEGLCRVVTLDEIRENDFNLNIPRYVEPVIEEESMTIDQAITNLRESLQAAYAAEDRLKELLLREGLL